MTPQKLPHLKWRVWQDSSNWKDSIVRGGEASPTLDKLEIYRDGPQTVLDSSHIHIDLFPILLRCE